MTFYEFFKEQNGGVLRGMQSKLAKQLEVSHVTIRNWMRGALKPSEIQIKKMSKLFKKSEEEIKKMLEKTKYANYSNGNNNFQVNCNEGRIVADLPTYRELLIKRLEAIEGKIDDKITKELDTLNLKLDLILEKLKK